MQRRRLEEAIGEGRVVGVENVRADLEADEVEEHERIHRQAEVALSLHDRLEWGADLDGVHGFAEKLAECG